MKPMKKSKARKNRVAEIEELFDPKTAKKFERAWQNELIDLEELAEEHFKYAREIFLLQDLPTREVITHMTETMQRMAGEPAFRFQGRVITDDMPRLRKIQQQNFLWMAVRLLVACAEWDIQVNNFKLPPGNCARCGTRTKGK